ncbi:MAG TPA: ABC transporter ATP-binding protein [Gemmatimonadales bacterium]|jgi:oligopeptide/dipeptide ABC transporter ATP-binding protein|nr:ABC transporter ATP-binding protein [Gemmatimonadales bacterium]
MTPLLEVRDLTISFPTERGEAVPVSHIGFRIERGETLALVGESGSGKSLTGLALLGLVPPPGRLAPGSRILLDGDDIAGQSGEVMRDIRGRRIGIVFQDALTSLTPVLTVGAQLREAISAHRRLPARQARENALALLAEVGLPDPPTSYSAYPHELSGGQRQRALIAIALAGQPDLLIADEATSALDVTIQAQVLETFDRLRATRAMAMLLITHDLGIVAGRADRVAVMYAGQIVETATTEGLFAAPAHPYTRALFRAIPRLDSSAEQLTTIPGSVPLPTEWRPGCRFEPRCPEALPECATLEPPVVPLGGGATSRCWLPARREQ